MKVKEFLAVVNDNAQVLLFEHFDGYDEPTTHTMSADHWRKLGLYSDRTIETVDVESDGTLWITLEALEDDR